MVKGWRSAALAWRRAEEMEEQEEMEVTETDGGVLRFLFVRLVRLLEPP
jgi:hypothetical protein